jgi:sortase A
VAKVKGGGVLRALELGLMMIGVACLTGFGLLQLDQYWGQASLRADFARNESHHVTPGAPALPRELPGDPDPQESRPSEPAPPPPGTALGRLTLDRIGLDVMIAEGVDHATLRRAAGHIPGTARLDGEGNIGVAAHRDTFFRPLREVRKGDVLEVETHEGRYRYGVEWTAVVDPENIEFLQAGDGPELTLVTCFPFHYVGPAPRRFIVRAKRLGGPAEMARAAQHGAAP